MFTNINVCLIALLLLAVTSCRQEFVDISDKKKYEGIVCKEYVIQRGLLLSAVTNKRNYEGPADLYVVTKEPGLYGPEILGVDWLKEGTVIKAERVLKCSNCPFGSPIVTSISIEGANINPNIPVHLYKLKKENPDGTVSLDPEYFREVDS